MTPLKTFSSLVSHLKNRPADFFGTDVQQEMVEQTKNSIQKLKGKLLQQDLKDTQAFEILCFLEKDIDGQEDKGVLFDHLNELIEIYRSGETGESLKELLENTEQDIIEAKKNFLEYRVAMDNLSKRGRKITEEKKIASDLDVIQKVGVFYVLEYTLQVLWEFQHLSNNDKKKVLDVGLQTETGNLPAFLPLEESFRKELCYKIFDDNLRKTLLVAFYNWEEVLYNQQSDFLALSLALKHFNITVLKSFQDKGYSIFKAAIYAPWGNNINIKELIIKLA